MCRAIDEAGGPSRAAAYASSALGEALGLPAGAGCGIVVRPPIRVVRWAAGTHCYAPLPAQYASRGAFVRDAQRPAPGVFAVGEALSRAQGWAEGALESVDAVWGDLARRLGAGPRGPGGGPPA